MAPCPICLDEDLTEVGELDCCVHRCALHVAPRLGSTSSPRFSRSNLHSLALVGGDESTFSCQRNASDRYGESLCSLLTMLSNSQKFSVVSSSSALDVRKVSVHAA